MYLGKYLAGNKVEEFNKVRNPPNSVYTVNLYII